MKPRHIWFIQRLNTLINLKVMIKNGKYASSINEKVSLPKVSFQSVYSPREKFKLKDFQPVNPTLKNISVTEKNLSISDRIRRHEIVGLTRVRRQLYQKTAKRMSAIVHFIMKNIKCRRKLPKNWKIGAVRSIFEKGDEKLLEVYTGRYIS